jgi:DNA-binding CsgD family transcriptional regulator
LLEAARRLDKLDPVLARDTHLDALGAAIFAGRFAGTNDVRAAAEAASAAPDAPGPDRAPDLLLDGLACRFTRGYVPALEPLRRALKAFAHQRGDVKGGLRWLWLAWPVANEIWGDEVWHNVTTRAVTFARDAGALSVLPIALLYRAAVLMGAGDFTAASTLIDEATAITEATGITPLTYVSPVLAALRGDELRALSLIDAAIRDATARGEGRAIALAEYARAVLYNGLGRYAEAQSAAEVVCERDDLGLVGWGLAELVEAATRNGRREVAVQAFHRLEERTSAAATNWARAIEGHSRALLSEGETAEANYRDAVRYLSSDHLLQYRARAHLLYGEWLRREGRRADARDQLRAALDLFDQMGAEAFAERSRRELLATGETVRKRSDDARHQLTAQEHQIARLAADGLSNQEIAAELFLSVRTIEWHLRKVYANLGINSRRQLRAALLQTVSVK